MCSGTGDRTPKPLSNSPQGERATAALDYVNATPLELSGVRTSQHRSPIPAFPKGKEAHQTPLNTASRDSRPLGRAGKGPPVSSGNSVGVAFSQPRVEGRSTSTLGIYIIRCSNSDGVAVSRRRYHNANHRYLYVGE